MFPVGVKVPDAGSYKSAEVEGSAPKKLLPPPVMRTFPFGRSVAVCESRPIVMLPVGAKLPVTGSYKAAAGDVGSQSPVTSTLPFGNKVAV